MTAKILICIVLLVSMSVIAAPGNDALVVFLVRHAEKLEGGHDPNLSVAGIERAKDLAMVLRDSGITHVHSSDYIRTRKTAAPLATALGLEVKLYDPRQLPALVDALRKTGGNHLVVGHSNTTPSLVELLGGDPGGAIDEPGEYDRLYIVTIDGDGLAHTVLLRYGRKFIGE
jgi:probable phosphoglycerate mutase